jgi:hypothetical protein
VYVYCSFICCESYFISHSTSVERLSARSCLGKNRESLRRYPVSLHVITHNLFTPCCLVRACTRFPCLPSQTTPHRSELLATMVSNEPPSSRANHTHSLNHAIGSCTSSSVARGKLPVTCRRSLLSVSSLHLGWFTYCHLTATSSTTIPRLTAVTFTIIFTSAIPEVSIANSHSSRDQKHSPPGTVIIRHRHCHYLRASTTSALREEWRQTASI